MDITACLCDRQADWESLRFICLGWVFVCWWNAEQKSLNVRDGESGVALSNNPLATSWPIHSARGFQLFVRQARWKEKEREGAENRQRQ